MDIWAVDATTAAGILNDEESPLSAMLSIRSVDDLPLSAADPPRVPLCELRFRDVGRDLPEGPNAELSLAASSGCARRSVGKGA